MRERNADVESTVNIHLYRHVLVYVSPRCYAAVAVKYTYTYVCVFSRVSWLVWVRKTATSEMRPKANVVS